MMHALTNQTEASSSPSQVDLLDVPDEYRSPFVELGYDLFLVILRHIAGENVDSIITTDAYRFVLPFAVCSRHHYAWTMRAIRGLSLLPINFTFDPNSRRRSQLPTHTTRVPPFPVALLPSTTSNNFSLPSVSDSHPSQPCSALHSPSVPCAPALKSSEKTRNGWYLAKYMSGRNVSQVNRVQSVETNIKPLRIVFPDPLLNSRLPKAVAGLPSLRTLHLFRNSEINDDALRGVVSNAPGLRELRIRTARKLSVRGLEALKNLSKLHMLDLSYCHNLGDECATLLASLPALCILLLAYWDLTDEGVQTILTSKSVTFLSLTACSRVSKSSCLAVARRNKLESLRFRSSLTLRDDAIATFATCSSLTYLDLSLSRRVGDDGIKKMLSSTGYHHRDYSHNDIRGGVKKNINCSNDQVVGLPNLHTLILSHCSQLSDDIATAILSHPRLSSVDLSYCHLISDRTAETLARSSCIEVLDLSGTSITDAGVEFLASLPCLRRLSLSKCNALTDAALHALSIRRSPLEVNLRGCQAISSHALLQFSTSCHQLLHPFNN